MATNCCLEVQSSIMQGLKNMLFWFFSWNLEICLNPGVADEHLLKYHTYFKYTIYVNIQVQL